MTLRRPYALILSAVLALSALVFLAPSAHADDPAAPDHLVIAAVWGANSDTGQWTNDWIELYNPTGQDIDLGTIDSSTSPATVTPNFSLCYRGVTTNPEKCSTNVKLYGTVKAHHYFLVWYPSKNTAGVTYTYPDGLTPDLDVSKKTDSNGNQVGTDMGGCNTGGQLLLLDPNASDAADAPTFIGDLSSPAAKTAGVVDGVGWTNAGTTQPNSAETNGATAITGVPAGTNNSCVLSRTFTDGIPVDTDTNRTDFTAVAPATFTVHSQISDHVAVAAVPDTEVSRDESMTPIHVQGSKGTGALTYAADGLPDGVAIDPATGVISGTPSKTDDLKAYPVTVTVTDSSPSGAETATTSFTLTVSNALRVDPVADVTVHRGADLTPIQITPHGGTPGYQYAATGLPAGVDIDASTGLISGSPTAAAGRYSVHVTVHDSGTGDAAQSASVDFTLVERPKATGPGQDDPLAGLRINEVKATGTPADDWVELVNTGAAVTGASVDLVTDSGDTYHVPSQDIAAGAYVVIDGADLHAAGVDLAATGTLDLTEADDTLLDETSWTAYPDTSWSRYPDGSGDFAVSKEATKGATNALPAAYATDHLVVAAVYGADGTAFNSDWTELYNPTDAPIDLGTLNDDGTVTPNYYQCYRSNASNTCSSMKLYGTVQPHHHFLIWNGHNADTTVDAHSKGQPPAGITPDLDFRYGTDDSNSADTKAANDPSGQVNNGFGGCNTGGQLWLLNASSGGTAPGGDMSSASARAAGVVDGVGWTAGGATQPTGAESKGSATVTGLSSGTNNACVIARKAANGYLIDSDANSTDFTTVQDPGTFDLQSQASERVAITPVDDAEISLGEAMSPLKVHAKAIFGDLTFAAAGLPDGVTIAPSTGVISGTPDDADELKDYPVTVTVGDSIASDTTTTTFTLTVSKVLRMDPIPDVSVHDGAAITPINAVAHGGTPGYTYAATGLPAGLTIDSSTGVISGTPSDKVGRYAVHVTATDSGTGDAAASVSRDFTIVELPPVGGPGADDPLAGLRINEVKAADKTADDWVELYNTGDAVSGASVSLVDSEGDSYAVPTQDVAADGYLTVDGDDLAAAGFHLTAGDTLYLTETDAATLLDQTSWTSYAPTSWARTTDGTGDFGVSAYPTKGKANSGAPVIKPNDLLVSEVNYDNNSTDYYEYSEVTNTTDHPIDFDAYGLSVTKSGAVMTLHDSSDTSGSSPVVDPVIPAHGTQLFWWDENQYLGVKTTAAFLANYGLPASTPVVLVQGFSSMANSGGDHSYYISVNQGSTPVSQAWVDTPCAANTLNGSAVCPATNGNYAEHYAVPADRTNAVAAVWYDSLHSGGDDVNYTKKAPFSTPGTVDLEQLGYTRAVKIKSVASDAVTLHNSSDAAVDLSGYVLQKNGTGAGYLLPSGTTVAAGDDLVIGSSDSGLTFADRDYVSLLAPRGYSYADGDGIADTTGAFLYTLPYDANSGEPPVIDPTTGLPLPPAGGLYRPAGISALGGTVYVSNTGDNLLASLANGSNTRVAGSLSGFGDKGDDGLAVDAQLYQPDGTAQDAKGDVFIADSGDNVIREITPDGVIHRFAGTGDTGGADEAVTSASTPLTVNLWHPNGVAVDAKGDVFITDTNDNRVLEVTPDGTITVVAGTGKAGYTGDGGAAATARLSEPTGIAVDAKDDVYVADSANNVIRRVDASSGVITTVAGDYAADQKQNDCLGGFAGDGGPATSAQLNDPQGVALDGAGDLFIADTFNHAVREVTSDGTISTVVNRSATAGAEATSPTGSGAVPASTHLNSPVAVAVDTSTNMLYIADTKNNAVAEVLNLAFAGNTAGPSEPTDQIPVTGSGKAANACAAAGNGPVVSKAAPTISGTPAVGSTLTAHPGIWTPTPDSFTYQWLRDGAAIKGATKPTYAVTSADAGHRLSVSVTAVKAEYASASATTAAVSVKVPAPGTLTTATPTISGTYQVGRRLTARPGTWKAGSATVRTFSYHWLRNGVAIPRATGSTYTLTKADYGRRISVKVTGSYAHYTSASKTSAQHRVLAGALTTAKPRISGRAKVGRRLTAEPGVWKAGTARLTGAHLRYQWFAGGRRIGGATHATYRIARKYRGKKIFVKVTGSYAGYATVTRTSRATTRTRAK